MKILVGADPELFLRKGDEFVSAHGVIAGTKDKPFVVDKGAVQVDGMALEFNIDPADSLDSFKENIDTVIGILAGMSPAGCSLEAIPTAHFTPEVMGVQPPEAIELGCDPDYNAYTGAPNDPPNADADFRTGAGHVHIGWCDGADIQCRDHLDACEAVARQLDFMLGLPSMLWDTDNQRRELYGKGGAYRPKPYGMEYRVLSNAWLSSPATIEYVYTQAIKAVEQVFSGEFYGSEEVREIIDYGMTAKAVDIIGRNSHLFGDTKVLAEAGSSVIGMGG